MDGNPSNGLTQKSVSIKAGVADYNSATPALFKKNYFSYFHLLLAKRIIKPVAIIKRDETRQQDK